MRLGSLIGLKPEYEERYIILHKYTFPGVLERIKKSHIRNYSIFLQGGILFSHLEYRGKDLAGDTAAMAADPVTQDWWKLTDPMQVPLEGRKDGDWWAPMEEIFHWSGPTPPAGIERRAAFASGLDPENLSGLKGRIRKEGSELLIPDEAEGLSRLTLFIWKDRLYAYSEREASSRRARGARRPVPLDMLTGMVEAAWTPMTEVFHTD